MESAKSLSEQNAEAMADARCQRDDRYPYMFGVMSICTLELERALTEIATGKVRVADARRIAMSALDRVRPKAVA